MISVLIAVIAFGVGAALAWVSAKAIQPDVADVDARLKLEEDALAQKERDAHEKLTKARERLDDVTRALEAVAGLSQEEARAQLIASIEGEVHDKLRGRLREEERRLEAESRERSARVLADAMQRQARSYVTQGAVTQVRLPSDDMKGRIIGRDGRNVRAFETATGTDLVIDESPSVVAVSAFNPLRRTIAATALERLVADGRIQPARIEEVVGEVKKELEDRLQGRGEAACREAEISAAMHPEVCKVLGRLHFHDAGGQSMLGHVVETALIAATFARELGLSAEAVEHARRAGLLHDVGKGIPDPSESHAEAGAKLAERYGEAKDVARAIRTHHAREPEGIIGVLVHVANTLSKERPGARRGAITTVSERLAELEGTVRAVEGVTAVYALQAGTELRVFVDPGTVPAQALDKTAAAIADRVAELHPTSAVNVTLIRESRAVATAKL